MAPALERKHWTVADYMALPDDGKRYEIAEATRIGIAMFSPADIEFADDTVVQPDVFVVPLVDGRGPRNWADVTGLLLAVEVLSDELVWQPDSAREPLRIDLPAFFTAALGE